MLKQTIKLFIKAIIIGVLLNLGIQRVSIEPAIPSQNNTSLEQQQPHQAPPVDTVISRFQQATG